MDGVHLITLNVALKCGTSYHLKGMLNHRESKRKLEEGVGGGAYSGVFWLGSQHSGCATCASTAISKILIWTHGNSQGAINRCGDVATCARKSQGALIDVSNYMIYENKVLC